MLFDFHRCKNVLSKKEKDLSAAAAAMIFVRL
jgi:hypothetical protein